MNVLTTATILTVLVAAPSLAQTTNPASLTLKGGLSISSVGGDVVGIPPDDVPVWITGFGGGLSAEYPISRSLSFKPELLYVMKGFSYGQRQARDPFGVLIGTKEEVRSADYLEVPILLRIHPQPAGALTAFVVVGPTIAFKLRERFEVTGAIDSSGTADEFSTFDAGVALGAGFEIGRGRHGWLIEGRYSQGLADVKLQQNKIVSKAVQVMIGYVHRP